MLYIKKATNDLIILKFVKHTKKSLTIVTGIYLIIIFAYEASWLDCCNALKNKNHAMNHNIDLPPTSGGILHEYAFLTVST